VVLGARPPISIPRTTVAPALLEELLGEISSLASVYHKPAETFVGRGRVGADSVQRKGQELLDDRFATQKALQTVAAGQQAENLLDFDDAPAVEGQPSGLAATEVLQQTPAAANLLAGTSSNPLDDLVSIFGGTSTTGAGSNGFGLGLGGMTTSMSSKPGGSGAGQQEDLLGLF